jgi:hypothetical protein
MKHQPKSNTHRTATLKSNTEQKSNTSAMKRSPPPHQKRDKYIQAVTGTLLYYARAVDSTILPALSSLTTKQANPMQKTMETVKLLLDYCATQEEAIITYVASKMILCIHSDA